MTKKQFWSEIIVSVIFLAIIVLFLNPMSFWMPDPLLKMLVGGLVVLFAVFVGLLWKERPADEREALHRALAARVAYIAGMSGLVVGVAVETLYSHPDPWLVVSLGIMVLAKLIGFIYGRFRY